jgi:FtsZ-binding cell division protein ZapB
MPDTWTLDRVLEVGLRLQIRTWTTLTPLEVGELGESLAFLTTEQQTTWRRIEAFDATVTELSAAIAGLQETIHALVTENRALRQQLSV